MSERSQTTLADYLRTLKRSRLLIAAVTLVCAAAALVASLLQEPSYEASASLSVRDPGQDLNLVGGAGASNQTPLQIASAHAPQVTRSAVVERVRREIDSRASLAEIRSLVNVEIDPNSYLVTINARSSDAEEAARIANAFAQIDAQLTSRQARSAYAAAADRLAKRIKELDTANSTTKAIYIDRLSNLQALSSVAEPVTVSEQAQVPGSPTSPKPLRNTAAAAVFGLLLGIALAQGRQMLDRRLREPSDAEQLFERPIVVKLRGDVFGHTGSLRDAELNGVGPLDPIDAESFRMLRENVRYLAIDEKLTTLAVTSAIPEEGKSTVAACLAMANAAAGKPTLLVECDLRRRVLAGRLGIAEGPGLTDYLIGRATPQEILQPVPAPGPVSANGAGSTSLVCIAAGSPPPRPADMLSSARFAEFLDKVAEVYERVIIDCPPLLPVADTLEVVPHVDGLLLCVRLNRTRLDQAEAAREALDRLPERPVGLVITDYTEPAGDYYRDYYHYREAPAPSATNGSDQAAPAAGKRPGAGAATSPKDG